MKIAFALPPILVNPGSKEGQLARKVIRDCASKVGRAKMRLQGVEFYIGGAFHPRASKIQNSIALRALLDCLIELNLICWDVCPNMKPFYDTKVFYRLMPSGAAWETTPTLYRRGHGDCKSFVAARVAELRKAGKVAMPVFRHVTDGWGTMFHILILHGNGTWECPSRVRGMHGIQEQPRNSVA